jgi:hypothetical protein
MSMVSRLRVVVLIAVSLWLGPWIVSAHAASSSSPPAAQPGPGCAGPPDSVFNQYCEPVPTATGGRTPGPGTPAVANTLPPAVVATISGGRPVTGAFAIGPVTRKKLVTLPIAAPVLLPVTGSATADPWSLAWWMILALVAIALALVATSVARQRRRRARAAPAPPAS